MPDLWVSFPRPCDERWEAMAPAGCDRVCARCDKVIHDLSRLELGEAEALLRRNPDTCVRASIGADGTVALKPGRRARARRMVIAAAATAGLLTAPAPAFARQGRPAGVIAGRVAFCSFNMRVTATDAGGQTFRARVRNDGRFRIKHLPAGTYRLTFESRGQEDQTFENVVVRDGEISWPNVDNGSQCVVVGLLRVEEARG